MTKTESLALFNQIKPDFFQKDYIRNRPDEKIFDEMLLKLADFDMNKYTKTFGKEITFGYYEGNLSDLKKEIAKVDEVWPDFFDGDQKIYCGYINGQVASFCMIEDFGSYEINGAKAKFAGPGCVGTLSEFRDKGIGLTMVNKATQIIKEQGYDYSYIHYTGVPGWYAKIGYETILRWNKNGVI